jgi:hypothetical protein
VSEIRAVFLMQPDVHLSDRNWLEFLSVLDATFVPVQGSDINEERKSECSQNIEKTRVFLAEIAELDGSKNRSAPLAILELEKKALSYGISSGVINLALGAAHTHSDILQMRALLLDRWRTTSLSSVTRRVASKICGLMWRILLLTQNRDG